MNYFNQKLEFNDGFNQNELDFNITQNDPMIYDLDNCNSFKKLDQDFNMNSLFKRNNCLESEEANEFTANIIYRKENIENLSIETINQIDLEPNYESERCDKEKCSNEVSSSITPVTGVQFEICKRELADSRNNHIQINDSLERKNELNLSCFSGIENSNIKKRFGRNEDRDMFEKLKNLCKMYNRDLNEFWKTNKELDSELEEILDRIYLEISFKGNKSYLLKRIRRIGLSTKFSVRESKLLRKLIIRQIIEGKINYNQIEYYFPGKSLESIKKEIVRMLHNI